MWPKSGVKGAGKMTFVTPRVLIFSAAVAVALSACEEGQMLAPGDETATGPVAQAARVEIQEVERPDIFGTKELALWDGRPSLGGIWVAHPDVTDPERVRIGNTTNGQTITGALFRRERANPGPSIQLSSDAAAALGILAGQPTELNIVVLRQEEVVIEAVPLPVDDADEDTEMDSTEENSSGETATSAVASTAAAVAAEAPPKRPGFWQRFKQSLKDDPDQSSESAAELATATAADASAPEVDTEPLDPLAAAAAAIDEAEEDTATLEQPVVESAAKVPATSGITNPYVQVGLFSVEANANAAAANLRQGGIVPTIAKGANDNRQFWRVIVGPMTNATEQAEMLGQVRALGYSDAFLAPN
jgi:rare lipoprotein A